MRSIHHIRSRMRWLILSLGMMWTMLLSAQSNINKVEYFFDTDPGFGSGSNVTVTTPAVNISSLSFSVGLTSITPGFHTLFVRSRNANGAWSLTNSSNLIRYQAQSAALGVTVKINKMEYFIDTDPGFGLGTNVPVTASADINGMTASVNLSSVSGGFHTLYIRSRDSLGRWSITATSNILKYQAQTATLGSLVSINKMEYFFDTDPGFGAGTNVPVTASADINGQVVPVNISALNGGYHILYLRSRDSLGRWSITSNSAFVKYTAPTATLGSLVSINKMEYFFDTDPGFGAGVNVPVTAATDINGMAVSVNVSALSGGVHTLYIRTCDSLGRWSITNNGSFVKYQTQTSALNPLVKIKRLEYFIDVDPGVGNASAVSITPTLDLSSYTFVANLSSVANGVHKLYVRSVDSVGRWSITNYGSFNGGTLQAPTATITVVGTQPLCAGTGYLRVNRDASPLATYQWKLGTVNILNANDTIFYPTSSGNYTVVVTNAVSSATSSVVAVTVNPAPTATISSGGTLAFCQGSSVTLSVNQTANASYQWKLNGSNIGGANTFSYVVTGSGVYNAVVTGNNGCSTASAKDTVTVTPSVTPTIVITASQYGICTGTLDSFTAVITNGGSSPVYQWKKNGVNVGSNSPVYASSVLVNNDTIYCVLTSNATCATPAVLTSNKIIMSVSSISAPSVSIATLQQVSCQGSTVTFTASPVNGGSSPSYQWFVNGALQGSTTGTFSTTSLANNDSVWCIMTSSSSCASVPTATSNHVGVTVNATVAPSVTVSVSQPSLCASALDTFTATPVNGGASPFYQWYRNGILQSGNSGTFITSSLSNNDSIWCVMTSSAACPSPSTATSNHVHMTVTATVVPGITISPLTSTICAGDSLTFTASITNGGVAPLYQWKRNGANVGGSSSVYGTRALSNNDSVWCVLTSNATCVSPASVASTHAHISVNPVAAPSVVVSASHTAICVGTNVTFTSVTTNGGSSPAYQWYKNGVLQASTTSTFSSTSLANGDTVWCVLTSNYTCATTSTAISNRIGMTVTSTVTPAVSIVASQLTICTASLDTFTATPVNGGAAPFYQWYRNGILQGGNTATYISSSLTNNDSVWCIMTSGATCASPATAASNRLRMTVNSYVTPTIFVSASPTVICSGDSVTYTASITNGGTSPIYQWKKNGVNVGTNSASYGSRAIAGTDSVWCVLISNVPCPTSTAVVSNKVRITVNLLVAPSVIITATQTTICLGTHVTFTAAAINGGANPTYNWFKNGSAVGNTSDTYIDSTLHAADSVWCVMNSSITCASPTSALSNHVLIAITTAVVPSVSVSTAQTTVCAGSSVTFVATPTNGGSSPVYQWYKNGIQQPGNLSTYTSSSLSNNDSVWCVMTSNAACVSPATATGNHVIMTITPNVTPTIVVTAIPTAICAGDSVTFTASITNGGSSPIYQWIKNGLTVGANSATYGSNALASTDSVWCVLTSNAPCPASTAVSSNHARVTVNPIVSPTVSVSATQTTICVGTHVTFTASLTNGGLNPSYYWFKNGLTVGNNTATYLDSTLANNDSIWCLINSNAACASSASATSNIVVITIVTAVVPSVSISTSLITICAGSSVTFTASPINGGSTPVYQWYRNGVLQVGNLGIYTSSLLANNDSVWCVMTSSAACVTIATAASNHVVMTVIQPVFYSYNADICPGSTYVFHSRILTQAGTYHDTLSAVNTCDSIVTLTLNVYTQARQVITASICPGDSFDFRGVQIYQQGIYTDTLAGAAMFGCDSIIQLSLAVRPVSVYIAFDTVCYGGSVVFHGTLITASGVYSDTLTGRNGCDSINMLHLRVSPLVSSAFSASTCRGYPYIFHGHTVTTAGIYSDTLRSVRGCDSIVYLTLSIRNNSADTLSASVCQGSVYVYHNRQLTQTGTYRDTFASANGCDSIVILNLVVNPKPSPVVTLRGVDTLRVTGTFSTYQWLRNNAVVTGAISATYIATQNGSYRLIVFNSSGCSDTSVAVAVTRVDIEDLALSDIRIYPNPAQNVVHIDADGLRANTSLVLIDALGQTVFETNVNSDSIHNDIDISSYASGVYILILRDQQSIYLSRRVVKN